MSCPFSSATSSRPDVPARIAGELWTTIERYRLPESGMSTARTSRSMFHSAPGGTRTLNLLNLNQTPLPNWATCAWYGRRDSNPQNLCHLKAAALPACPRPHKNQGRETTPRSISKYATCVTQISQQPSHSEVGLTVAWASKAFSISSR